MIISYVSWHFCMFLVQKWLKKNHRKFRTPGLPPPYLGLRPKFYELFFGGFPYTFSSLTGGPNWSFRCLYIITLKARGKKYFLNLSFKARVNIIFWVTHGHCKILNIWCWGQERSESLKNKRSTLVALGYSNLLFCKQLVAIFQSNLIGIYLITL